MLAGYHLLILRTKLSNSSSGKGWYYSKNLLYLQEDTILLPGTTSEPLTDVQWDLNLSQRSRLANPFCSYPKLREAPNSIGHVWMALLFEKIENG
ncbi:hypothetical protein TNCV_544991 [Trichonephila clavipes]|nr:hypothetical protein TNCV_544991 [Trichonephila clavipes]